MEHFFVVVAQESKLEAILRRVNGDRSRTCRTVEAVNGAALDSSEINRVVERANDTSIANGYIDK